MTEWIVDNIGESFEKKDFPAYKEVFDMFTRVFIQCRQVAVPMDILRMALYEKIREGKIELKKQHDEPPLVPESKKIQEITAPKAELSTEEHLLWTPEHELPSPAHELPQPQKELTPQEKIVISEELKTEPLIEKENPVDEKDFSAWSYLAKIQESGVKQTLLPLLRTADIEIKDTILTIATTSFAKKLCEEPKTWTILTECALIFGAKIEEIRDIGNTISDDMNEARENHKELQEYFQKQGISEEDYEAEIDKELEKLMNLKSNNIEEYPELNKNQDLKNKDEIKDNESKNELVA